MKRLDASVPSGFQTKKGRIFTIGPVEHTPPRFHGDTLWCDMFPILRHGKRAGQLFRDLTYGTTAEGAPRWHGSLSELRAPYMFSLPERTGYDVAAYDTIQLVIEAWSRSADEILNFEETLGSATERTAPKCRECRKVLPVHTHMISTQIRTPHPTLEGETNLETEDRQVPTGHFGRLGDDLFCDEWCGYRYARKARREGKGTRKVAAR